MHHYIPVVPLNSDSQARGVRRKTGARKRHMQSLAITFETLQTALQENIKSGHGPSASSEANLRSGLKAFLDEQGLRLSDVVGSTLRASYYRNLSAHAETLKAANRTSEYIRNRKTCLARWRKLVLEVDRASAANDVRKTPLQIAMEELLENGPSLASIAERTSVPLSHIRRWKAGGLPKPRSAHWLRQLERHFGLTSGTLSDLVPGLNGGEKQLDAVPQKKSAYRERLRKALAEEPYALNTPLGQLREEWAGLLHHKTAVRPPLGLQRQAKGRWKGTLDPVVKNADACWFAYTDGRFHATAKMNWSYVSYFLGWLQMPQDRGGLALSPAEAQTLANLANEHLIERYNTWRMNRSGGVMHGGCVAILKTVQMLCHPRTGYLTQSYALFSSTAGVTDEAAWRSRCDSAFKCAVDIRRELRNEMEKSRDPYESMSHIFSMANPMEAVADAIIRMDADRPITGGESEAVWARDRLMVKLFASNPLRAKNMKLLTYFPDNSGQLRKVDGGWRITLHRGQFKNLAGAAGERSYDMTVRPEVWPDIERYIKLYRPQLAAPNSPYLFVQPTGGMGPWHGMNRRFETLTKRYFQGCPGTGPHIMRHLVATSILKQQPNAWAVAAWALHDKEETVRAAYAHLGSDDASRWLEPLMAKAFARM